MSMTPIHRFGLLAACLLAVLAVTPAADGQNFTSDVTIAGDNPDLEFNDTSSNDASWEICTDDLGCDSIGSGAGYNESFHTGWREGSEFGLPFVLRRGAPSDSLHVDPLGMVGLGTATPAADLHVLDSTDGATLFLEDGVTSKAFEIKSQFGTVDFFNAGTIAPFMRVLESPPSLSIAIAPDRMSLAGEAMTLLTGAPSQSLTVDAEGQVGLGTLAPQQQMELLSTNPTIQLTDLQGGLERAWYLNLNTNGELFDISSGINGTFSASPIKVFAGATTNSLVVGDVRRSDFIHTAVGIATDEPDETLHVAGSALVEDAMFVDGNLTVGGSFFVTSSRELKEVVGAVDVEGVLAKVASLPLRRWSYLDAPVATDAGPERRPVHLGPMAEDFRELFGLGHDARSLSPIDGVGVALAAIQGLHAEVEELRRERGRLAEELRELRALLTSDASEEGATP